VPINIVKLVETENPVDKIKMFGKAFGLLQNSMTFSSGKSELEIDDVLPLVIYVILKAKPKMIAKPNEERIISLNKTSTEKPSTAHNQIIAQERFDPRS